MTRAMGGEAVAGASAPADERRITIASWWMVFVLFCFYLMSQIDRGIIAQFVDPIRKTYNLGDFQMSLILGPAFAVSYSLAALPGGWIVDKFDRRLVAGGAMMFWSLATMACGFAPGLIWLAVARMMLAVGEAMLNPVAFAFIGDCFPKARLSSAMAVYNTAPKVGASLSYFTVAAAIVAALALKTNFAPAAGFATWQIVFVVFAAPGLILAFLPLTFGGAYARPQGHATKTVSAAPRESLLAFIKEHRAFLIPLFLANALTAIVNGALTAWLPTFMQRHYGWTPAQYGPPIGTIVAVAAVVTVFHGLIIDRLFKRGVRRSSARYFSWTLAASLPFVFAAFFMANPWHFLICLAAIYVLVLPYSLYFSIGIQMITPSHLRGRMTGLTIAVVPVFSQGLGPMLIGGLTDFVYHDPMKIGSALAVVMIGGLTTALVFQRLALVERKPARAEAT